MRSTALAAVGACVLAAHAEVRLPAGFIAETVASGINAATALTVAPDGRVFVAEQTGRVLIVTAEGALPEPLLDLGDRLDTYWERGLIGITLHPDFPRQPFLYVVYVAKAPHTHHVVSRFTVEGNRVDPASELPLLLGDDQAKIAGGVPAGHQGGPLAFGPDGMLYIGIGEHTRSEAAQELDTLQGKILRIAPDGSIPPDNPFVDQTRDRYRSIYARGIRNPFGLAFDPSSGKLYVSDVGAAAFEEINEIRAGANYGWPLAEGFADKHGLVDPLHAYPPAIGRSICGGAFYPATGPFPTEWRGKMFVADWAAHWIRAFDPAAPSELLPFGEGFQAPVALAAGSAGELWVLNRNTIWRDPDEFQPESGSLVRIRHLGTAAPPATASPHAPTLTASGAFSSLDPLAPAAGFKPFDLAAPRWLPGVATRRWLHLPPDARITPREEGVWDFPPGTRIIEHFDTTDGRPFETHLYVALADRRFRAAAYRWEQGEGDPALITLGAVVPLGAPGDLHWFSPGPVDALDPRTAVIGFVPQWTSGQLNVPGQLDAWIAQGWLAPVDVPGLPKLSALEDSTASVAARVRSYLDANCAACHHPGGPARGNFDLRFQTPYLETGLHDAVPLAGDLGIQGARVVAPGAPEKSILLERMRRHDAMRMPPIALDPAPSPALPLVETWIQQLDASPHPSDIQLDEAIDNGQPAYRVTTPGGIWFLEKSGGGLSSLIDSHGKDWLAFNPAPGTGAGGEYRGFPNAVHKQGASHFHPRNQGTDPLLTEVEAVEADRIAILATAPSGLWQARYEFFADHCRFTMLKCPPDRSYWILYEGVPGGGIDPGDWWCSSGQPRRQSISTASEGDLPAPEWIAFGDATDETALLVLQHHDDDFPDHYYLMEERMTVFGFGRAGMKAHLQQVPASYSIGLVPSPSAETLQRHAEAWLKTRP